MKRLLIVVGLVAGLALGVVALTVPAGADEGITATVTAELVAVTGDCTGSPCAFDYGVLGTSANAFSPIITVENTGNVDEDFSLQGSDATDDVANILANEWALEATIAANQYTHEFDDDTASFASPGFLNDSSGVSLIAGVSPAGTETFKLRIKMPSSTTTTNAHSVDVTILATAN